MVAMLLSIFDKSLSGCKTTKSLMILRVLSKLTEFPYAAMLKLGGLLILTQFCYRSCCFSQVLRLDCVRNRILQYFHKSQKINLGSDL